jgi:DNA processing protein
MTTGRGMAPATGLVDRGGPPGRADPQSSRFTITDDDPRWPSCLSELGTLNGNLRVASLSVEGTLPSLPGIAVVGSRRATAAGQEVARRIGRDLGRRGVTVVSGFARGVDVAAHRGCLSAGGMTLAVLGCGLDVDYPTQHQELRRDVARSGALLSEYADDDPPEAWRFPHRNRIIAALCKAVIVVEAGRESGALSTARWAADLGRAVLAVPGSILGPANVGSNLLLRDGVPPYLDPSDLADVCAACADVLPGIPAPRRRVALTGGGDSSLLRRRVVQLLGAEPVSREILARKLEIGGAELAVLLGEMELDGLVRGLSGGRVVRATW